MENYPGTPHRLPDGEMFWIADRTILVDHLVEMVSHAARVIDDQPS